jgi:hypothetical protein
MLGQNPQNENHTAIRTCLLFSMQTHYYANMRSSLLLDHLVVDNRFSRVLHYSPAKHVIRIIYCRSSCRLFSSNLALVWTECGMPWSNWMWTVCASWSNSWTLELAASQETCRQLDISSALHWNGMGMPLLLSSLGTSENSERKNKCILESYRSKDQKSCFKASTSAGLQCINKVSPFRFSTTIWYRNNNQSGGVET